MKLTRSGYIFVNHPDTGEQHSRHYQEREAIEKAINLGRKLGQNVTIQYNMTVLVEPSLPDSSEPEPDPEPEPEPPPAIEEPGFSSDGLDLYDMTVSDAFDPSAPTLKDGTGFTATMRKLYDATLHWALSNPTGGWRYVNVIDRLAHPDMYHTARYGLTSWQAIMAAYRMTGDPRLLDKLAEAATAMRASLVVEWGDFDQAAYQDANSGACFDGVPWAPYLKKIRQDDGGVFWGSFTDGHAMNEERYSGLIGEMAWLFHVNRDASTPGGHDFRALAQFYGQQCVNFVRKWSEDTPACWAHNYRGVDYKRSYRERAEEGSWPVCGKQGDNHSTWESIRAHHYFEALRGVGWDIPPGAGAQRDEFCDDLLDFVLIPCQTSYGEGLAMKRSWRGLGDSSDIAIGATYMGYVSWSALHCALAFRSDVFTRDTMVLLGRSFADTLNDDGSTKSSIIGDNAKCGLQPESTSKARTANQNAIKGIGAGLLVWDTPDGRLNTIAERVQNDVAGGYVTPNSGLFPAGQFVAEALRVVDGA